MKINPDELVTIITEAAENGEERTEERMGKIIDEKDKIIDNQSAVIQDLKNKVESLKEQPIDPELSELKTSHKELSESYDRRIDDIRELEDKLTTLRKENAEWTHKYKALEEGYYAKVDEAEQLTALRQEKSRLAKKCNGLLEELNDIKDATAKSIDTLNEELLDRSNTISHYSSKSATYKSQARILKQFILENHKNINIEELLEDGE